MRTAGSEARGNEMQKLEVRRQDSGGVNRTPETGVRGWKLEQEEIVEC
jgi:hypothetical protein